MLKELDAAHEEGLIERHCLLSLRERVQRVADAAISEKRVGLLPNPTRVWYFGVATEPTSRSRRTAARRPRWSSPRPWRSRPGRRAG
jgi:hypothetical protein